MTIPVLALPMLVGVLLFAPTASAATAHPRSGGTDDQRAVELLRRSADAAQRMSYTGTQYVATWSALSKSARSTSAVVQVRHEAGGRTEIRVHDRQTAILSGPNAANWLAGEEPVALLLGAYDVRLAGDGNVAGRDAWVVEAYRPDGSVAARLWLDQQTALSLRREAFAADGYLLGATAFVDVTVGGPCCGSKMAAGTMWSGSSPSDEPDDSMLGWPDIENLRDDGWHCPRDLTDGMVLYEARRVGDAVHLSYSDGVMAVSVFEQPGRLDPGRLRGYSVTERAGGIVYTLPGPPARLVWSSGGTVVTVVAEAPMENVEVLTELLPPDRPVEDQSDGIVDRIGRGAQRVGSWLNPFD